MKIKKKFTRIISCAMALVMLCGLVPISSMTASAATQKSVSLSSLGKKGTVTYGSKSKAGTWWKMNVGSKEAFCINLGDTCHAGNTYEAKEMAQLKVKKGRQKGKVIQKSIGKMETKKKENRKKEYRASGQGKSAFQVVGNITTTTKEAMLTSMHFLLLGESASEDGFYSDSREQSVHPAEVPKSVARHSARRTGGVIRNSIRRNAMKRKARKQAMHMGNKSAQSAVKGAQKAAQGTAKLIQAGIQAVAANPIRQCYFLHHE